jgi:excisionase family DNA binding protein
MTKNVMVTSGTAASHRAHKSALMTERLALSPREVAEALGVTRQTVQVWIARAEIQSVRIGGRRFIRVAELHRLLGEAGISEVEE